MRSDLKVCADSAAMHFPRPVRNHERCLNVCSVGAVQKNLLKLHPTNKSFEVTLTDRQVIEIRGE